MAKINCFDAIRAAFKEKNVDITDAELKTIVDEVSNIRSRIFETGEDMAGPVFREKVTNYLKERRYAAAAERRETVENIQKKYRNIAEMSQSQFEGDPAEALRGMLVGGVQRYSKGGNLGAGNIQVAQSGKLLGNILYALKDANLLEVAQKGLLDREAAIETFELRDGGQPGKTGSAEAQKYAKIINAANNQLLELKQMSGSSVRRLDGYITRQIWDSSKSLKAGFKDWLAAVGPELDYEKSFKGLSNDKIEKELFDSWKQITSGQQINTLGDMTSNLDRKMSQARTLHFKDAEAWLRVKEKFGNDKSLLQHVVSDIESSTSRTALMYRFGTNAEDGYNAVKTAIYDKYRDDPKALEKFRGKEAGLDESFRYLQRVGAAPGTDPAARFGQGLRAVATLAHYSGATLATPPDLAQAVMSLKSVTGQNVLELTSNLVGEFANVASNSRERMHIMQSLGVYSEAYMGDLHSKMGGEAAGPGKLADLQRKLFSLNGLSFVTDSSKAATAAVYSNWLTRHVEVPFAELPARLRMGLERYGFNSDEWAQMHRAVMDVEGRKFLTPEAFKSIPDDFFGDKQGKFNAETKLLAMLNDFASMGTTSPDARQRAFLIGGSKDDGGFGTLRRVLAMAKGVPLRAFNTLGRVLMSNPETAPKTLSEALTKGDLAGTTQLIVFSTVMGYLSMVAKDAVDGKTPRDPKDWKTMQEAMARGGAGGLYSDFLVGEFNRSRTAIDLAAGPALKPFGDTAEFLYKLRNGDAKAKELFSIFLKDGGTSLVPGLREVAPLQNLPLVKGALDKILLYQFQENLNPGYLRRLEQRARTTGQSYFMNRPTERVQ